MARSLTPLIHLHTRPRLQHASHFSNIKILNQSRGQCSWLIWCCNELKKSSISLVQIIIDEMTTHLEGVNIYAGWMRGMHMCNNPSCPLGDGNYGQQDHVWVHEQLTWNSSWHEISKVSWSTSFDVKYNMKLQLFQLLKLLWSTTLYMLQLIV